MNASHNLEAKSTTG